jgi:hypothetical protein
MCFFLKHEFAFFPKKTAWQIYEPLAQLFIQPDFRNIHVLAPKIAKKSTSGPLGSWLTSRGKFKTPREIKPLSKNVRCECAQLICEPKMAQQVPY